MRQLAAFAFFAALLALAACSPSHEGASATPGSGVSSAPAGNQKLITLEITGMT